MIRRDRWLPFGVRHVAGAALALAFAAPTGAATAQETQLHPLLPEQEEIELARSAAPAALSDSADIYVLRRGGHIRVVEGTNGAACLVTRDHLESLYPICHDSASAATVMQLELFAQRLRERGVWGDSLRAEIDAAFERGELRAPTSVALAYMMSPYQVLYTGEDGRRVGRWHPHVMIYGPGLSQRGIGFPGYGDGNFSVSEEPGPLPTLVIFTDWAVPPPTDTSP